MKRARIALLRRTVATSRIRDGAFALFFFLFAYANPVGYRHTYPTQQERTAFAERFGTNRAVELFYGVPHDLLSTGGFTAWRFGGFAAVVAAIWGSFAAARAFRGEEDAGRQELVLAGALGRRDAFLAATAALGTLAAALWLATLAGLAAGGLAVGGSGFLALATTSCAAVFVGVGALAGQLASNGRLAHGCALAVVAAAFLLRVIADTASGLGWLRWATPLGWAEELRPFAGSRPAVLALPALATAALLAGAAAISARRDVGTGLIHARDTAEPDVRLLSSPLGLAIRTGRGPLAAWSAGVGLFALVVGVLSTSFTSKDISESLQRELRRVGGASLTTPAGTIGFYFLLFAVAIVLYAGAQVSAIRREEADSQLETLFARPVDRNGWLVGRLALAAAGAALLALAAAVCTWAGAASQHAGVGLARLLEAGANCLPVAVLFLGLAALVYAFVPRATGGIVYGTITVSFVWELLGGLLGAPPWLLDASPFAHLGLVPAQPFRAAAALSMLAIGLVTAAAGVAVFRRRDLVGY